MRHPPLTSIHLPASENPWHPTCFGPDQWQWIRQALKESRATFKVLAMGQIWQRKKNSENDDMFTYYVERHFLLESSRKSVALASEGDTWALSLGLRASCDPDKVNLEIHTHTLQPAVPDTNRTTRPVETSRGPFPHWVDRVSLIDRWNHAAVTFHGDKLRLYVNGTLAVEHALPVWGGISETSELVIGGHRDGTGRNYNGLIDEVGLWARVLEPEEIAALADADQAPVISTELRAADSDGDGSQDRQEVLHGLDPG